MTVSSVSSSNSPLLQSVLNIDNQLDNLQQELSTGEAADSYAGLGPQAGVTVGLSAQLAALNSFGDTMTNADTSIGIQQSVLQQLSSVASTVQAATVEPTAFSVDNTGQTSEQETAQAQLSQILSSLNTQGGNGYLFSGAATNQPSVASVSDILNGNGSQAGLEQVIAERNQADLGADGLGRLVIPPVSGTTVSVNEDVAGSPFGLKLTGVSSSLTGATVTGPTGSLATISADLGATNPNNGDTITYTFSLPDGSTQTLQLQATTSTTPGTNQFTIGATPAATAANLQAALTAGVSQIGSTSLSAASAMAAASNFFDDPPQRVDGPPFDTATSLVNGTPSNTVSWYTGENGSESPRSTAVAQINPSTTVSYGTQANEQGIQWIVQNIAVLAATSYSPSDPNASASYAALNQRVYSALAVPAGVQSVDDIEASLASAQTAMKSVQSQNQQTSTTLTNMLQSIEGVNTTQVGVEILALQNNLSASLSTTARLSQINLLTYLAPVS
jgi:flagellar hook-associated protein 3 FlgL